MLLRLSCVGPYPVLYAGYRLNTFRRGAVCKLGRLHMIQFVGKRLLQRANTVLVLTLVWGGVAACAIAATVYDISHWFLG